MRFTAILTTVNIDNLQMKIVIFLFAQNMMVLANTDNLYFVKREKKIIYSPVIPKFVI